jgi:rhomboid protease GluP
MVVVSVHSSQQPVSESLGSVWQGFSGRLLLLFGGKYGPLITEHGQWWRLLTAGFLHGGLLHIAMNTWVLFDLVAEVEQFYGSARLIIMYLFSTFTGFLLSTLWDPGTVSIGASAACFGLIGAMMAIGIGRSHPMAQAIRSYYRRWAIYGIIFSFMPFMRIDVAAHLGGLAGGFIVGYLAGLPTAPKSTRERVCQAIAGVSLLAVVYCFLQDFRFYQAIQASMFVQ